jgi:hypothetical protein
VKGRLKNPRRNDWAHRISADLCLYWKSAQCGFTIPPSKFVIAILNLLDVAPSQLSSVA